MGADGGVMLTKMSAIRKNWKKIESEIIKELYDDLSKAKGWEISSLEELINLIEKWPKNIENKSDEELVELLSVLRSCDCPYLYSDTLITGYGDYVPREMNTLSWILRRECDGFYIETWT